MCFLSYRKHQEWCYEYNPIGKVIRETDPVGRTKIFTYAEDGVDLLEARQVSGQDAEPVAGSGLKTGDGGSPRLQYSVAFEKSGDDCR